MILNSQFNWLYHNYMWGLQPSTYQCKVSYHSKVYCCLAWRLIIFIAFSILSFSWLSFATLKCILSCNAFGHSLTVSFLARFLLSIILNGKKLALWTVLNSPLLYSLLFVFFQYRSFATHSWIRLSLSTFLCLSLSVPAPFAVLCGHSSLTVSFLAQFRLSAFRGSPSLPYM